MTTVQKPGKGGATDQTGAADVRAAAGAEAQASRPVSKAKAKKQKSKAAMRKAAGKKSR